MVRAVLVLLTIGGISACPLVCTESGHSTGREDSGHRDRAPDPCGQHGCVCKGAVQCRDDPAPEATPVLAAPYGAAAWIYAGGPHHTVFSQAATAEHIEDLAEMAGVQCLFIDGQTRLRDFKQQLR